MQANTGKWLAGLLGVIVIVLLAVLIFVSGKSQFPQSNKPVKIGGLFGLSGFVSFAAEDSRDGFLMAMEDHGYNNYVIEDGQSSIPKTLTAARKLIDIDNVEVVIGPEWNEFGEALIPIATESKVPFISPWAASEADWTKSGWYFSMTPSERSHQVRQLKHMLDSGVKTIGLIYTDNAWSLENINIFKSELGKTSITITYELKARSTQTDFRTDIAQLKNAKPDALYTPFAAGSQAGPFFKQLAEQGFKPLVHAPESIGQDDVIRGQFNQYVDGLIYPTPKLYKNSDAFNVKFAEEYKRKPTTRTAATTYDAVTLVLKAVESGAHTGQEIRDYLSKVKDFDGYSSIVNFGPDGFLLSEEVDLNQVNVTAGKDQIVQ